MTKKKTPATKTSAEPQPAAQLTPDGVEETPMEALASILSVLVIGLFILTFIGQNFVIPSGSMENTLLVGDHLMVDRTTLALPSKWMPLVHYREPKRGDIVVFYKPVAEPEPDADGNPQYLVLVKRLVGLPGDRIHLRDGIVILNGVAQEQPHAQPTTPENHDDFLDEFPAEPPPAIAQVPDSWLMADFPKNLDKGDLVVPPGHFFMMGDNRHSSLDSRYWGFVPRENIVGRPLFNYWSFETPDNTLDQPGVGNSLKWMGHVALHFFTDTRWSRTLHRVQ